MANINTYTTINNENQPFTGTLAISDAKHDKLVKGTPDYEAKLLQGLPQTPGSAYEFKDEDSVFNQLFHNTRNDTVLEGRLKTTRTTNAKSTLESLKQPVVCGIGIGNGIGNGIKDYDIYNIPVKRKYVIGGKRYFVKGDDSPLGVNDSFATFLRNKIPGNDNTCPINFIVDFNQCSFLEMVWKDSKKAEQVETQPKINYLMTPEVLNDPAGKTNLEDNLFKENNTIFRPYLEIDDGGRVYSAFNDDASKQGTEILENNFYSKYNISLNKLKPQIGSKSYKLIGDGSISYGKLNGGDNGVYEFSSEDGSNSNKKTQSRLTSLFNMMSRRQNQVMDIFSYNAQIQHKRSGDWLQALACGLIDGRTFINTQTNVQETISNNITYFVSHDKNAVSYALLMGLNVIYLTYKLESGVLVFNNTKNKNFEQLTPKAIEDAMKQNMETYLTNNYFSTPTTRGLQRIGTPAAQYENWHSNYDQARTTLIAEYNDLIITQYRNITIFIGDANKIEIKIKNLSDGLSKYFQLLVELAFVYKTFPDLDNEFAILNPRVGSDLNTLQQQINAYTKIKNVRDLFGYPNDTIINSDLLLKDGFVRYIKKNLYKLDVYLSVSTAFILDKDSSGSRNVYMKTIFGSSNRETDSKISDISSFIAYLNELPTNYIVEIYTISESLYNLSTVLSVEINELRSKRQQRPISFLNILNVLNESIKILPAPQSVNQQTDIVSNLETLLGTDNKSSVTSITENNTSIIKSLSNNDSTNLPDGTDTSNINETDIGVNTKNPNQSVDDIEEGTDPVPILDTELDNVLKKVETNNYYTRYLKNNPTSRDSSSFFRNTTNWLSRPGRLRGGKLGEIGANNSGVVDQQENHGLVLDIFQTRVYWPILFYDSYVNYSPISIKKLMSAVSNLFDDDSDNVFPIAQYVASPIISRLPDLTPDTSINEEYNNLLQLVKNKSQYSQTGGPLIDISEIGVGVGVGAELLAYYLFFTLITELSKMFGGKDTSPLEQDSPMQIQMPNKISKSNKKFIFKKEYGCHPLLPLYNILTSYWYNISERMVTCPDFPYFYQYYQFLHKCFEVLNDKYLKGGDKLNILKAFIISKGLLTLLFNVSTNTELSNKFEQMINFNNNPEEGKTPETEEGKTLETEEGKTPETEEGKTPETEEGKTPETEEGKTPETEEGKLDILLFTMINGIFSNYFCGTVKLSEEDNKIAQIYINNPLFGNFINNEVDFKNLFEKSEESLDINIETPESIEETMNKLQEDVFNDIVEITKIIEADYREEKPTISSSQELDLNKNVTDKQLSDPTFNRGQLMNRPPSRISPSMMVPRQTRSQGGKKKTKKRNNKKKRKNRKTNKKKSKTRKNKTRKNKRKTKKSKKTIKKR